MLQTPVRPDRRLKRGPSLPRIRSRRLREFEELANSLAEKCDPGAREAVATFFRCKLDTLECLFDFPWAMAEVDGKLVANFTIGQHCSVRLRFLASPENRFEWRLYQEGQLTDFAYAPIAAESVIDFAASLPVSDSSCDTIRLSSCESSVGGLR